MPLQGQTARREHKVSVGTRESVFQGFGGSEEVSTTKYGQRIRGINGLQDRNEDKAKVYYRY